MFDGDFMMFMTLFFENVIHLKVILNYITLNNQFERARAFSYK